MTKMVPALRKQTLNWGRKDHSLTCPVNSSESCWGNSGSSASSAPPPHTPSPSEGTLHGKGQAGSALPQSTPCAGVRRSGVGAGCAPSFVLPHLLCLRLVGSTPGGPWDVEAGGPPWSADSAAHSPSDQQAVETPVLLAGPGVPTPAGSGHSGWQPGFRHCPRALGPEQGRWGGAP